MVGCCGVGLEGEEGVCDGEEVFFDEGDFALELLVRRGCLGFSIGMVLCLTSASMLSMADFVLARPSFAVFNSASRSLVDSWSRVTFWSMILWCWKM